MEILVMGAGGVGGLLGGLLGRCGNEVTLVARGEHLRAMQANGGLIIRTDAGEFLCRAALTHDPMGVTRADLVILAAKTHDNGVTIPAIRSLVGPSCPAMTVQNGVDAARDLAAAYGPAQVIASAIAVGCHIEKPGVIRGPSDPSKIAMGIAEMEGARSKQRLLRIQQMFSTAGIPVEIHSDACTLLWKKLLLVGPRSIVQALTRKTLPELASDPEAMDRVEKLLGEYIRVGRANGAVLPDDLVGELMRPVREGRASAAPTVYGGQMPSLLRDVLTGRPLEVEAMIGGVVRRAERHGIPVPVARECYERLARLDWENRARREEKS